MTVVLTTFVVNLVPCTVSTNHATGKQGTTVVRARDKVKGRWERRWLLSVPGRPYRPLHCTRAPRLSCTASARRFPLTCTTTAAPDVHRDYPTSDLVYPRSLLVPRTVQMAVVVASGGGGDGDGNDRDDAVLDPPTALHHDMVRALCYPVPFLIQTYWSGQTHFILW